MLHRLKRSVIVFLTAFLLALIAQPALAQEVEPTPEAAAPVIVVPVEVQETAEDNSIAAFALFGGISLIVIGVIAGVAIRYVANLVPPEFAAPVYSTGNTFYSKRQQFIETKRAEARLNNIAWDDPFWDAALKVSADEWQKFIEEARAKGVVLQPLKRE